MFLANSRCDRLRARRYFAPEHELPHLAISGRLKCAVCRTGKISAFTASSVAQALRSSASQRAACCGVYGLQCRSPALALAQRRYGNALSCYGRRCGQPNGGGGARTQNRRSACANCSQRRVSPRCVEIASRRVGRQTGGNAVCCNRRFPISAITATTSAAINEGIALRLLRRLARRCWRWRAKRGQRRGCRNGTADAYCGWRANSASRLAGFYG